MLKMWHFNKYRTIDTYGAAWIELPWWLRDNMLKWLETLAWFELEAKQPRADGLPNREDI